MHRPLQMTEAQWQGIYDFFAYPGNSRPTTDIDLNPERIVTFYGDVNSINTITRFAPLTQRWHARFALRLTLPS